MSYDTLRIPWNLESPYSEMSTSGAKEFFEWLKLNATYRISELSSLVAGAGMPVDLDYSPESLIPLGEWLSENLQTRRRTREEMHDLLEGAPDWVKESIQNRNTELTGRSFSIAFDVALYFSLILMRADSKIQWKIHSSASKLDADRNQVVLTGPSKMRYNPIRTVLLICFKLAKGEFASNHLYKLYQSWHNNLLNK